MKSKGEKIIESTNIKARVSVHWLLIATQNGQGGGREFQHPAGI